MKVYCCKPMAGRSYEEVAGYYNELKEIFDDVGIKILNPMCGKSYLKGQNLVSTGHKENLSTDHAIVCRDRWMVKQSDVVFVNLLDCNKVSIGSMFEMAWAVAYNKHIVLLIEDEFGHHKHAFVFESAHVIYNDFQSAVDYLIKLSQGEI